MARRPTTSTSRARSPSRRSTSSRSTAPPSRAPTRRSSSPSSEGKITDPAPRAAVTGALDKVRELEGVQVVEDPFAKGGTLSRDGRLASVAVRYCTEPQDLEKPDGEALVEAAESGERDGVSVAERGILIDLASEQDAPVGELIGVAIAIILLTLLFRSLAAMAVTLAGALIGVVVGPDPAGRARRAARPAGLRDA